MKLVDELHAALESGLRRYARNENLRLEDVARVMFQDGMRTPVAELDAPEEFEGTLRKRRGRASFVVVTPGKRRNVAVDVTYRFV